MIATETSRVRWGFLQSPWADLTWYIGSSLAGWLYVVLVLVLGRRLQDPVHDPFARLDLLGMSLPLTLGLLVIASTLSSSTRDPGSSSSSRPWRARSTPRSPG